MSEAPASYSSVGSWPGRRRCGRRRSSSSLPRGIAGEDGAPRRIRKIRPEVERPHPRPLEERNRRACSIEPRIILFGDTIRAHVDVVARSDAGRPGLASASQTEFVAVGDRRTADRERRDRRHEHARCVRRTRLRCLTRARACRRTKRARSSSTAGACRTHAPGARWRRRRSIAVRLAAPPRLLAALRRRTSKGRRASSAVARADLVVASRRVLPDPPRPRLVLLVSALLLLAAAGAVAARTSRRPRTSAPPSRAEPEPEPLADRSLRSSRRSRCSRRRFAPTAWRTSAARSSSWPRSSTSWAIPSSRGRARARVVGGRSARSSRRRGARGTCSGRRSSRRKCERERQCGDRDHDCGATASRGAHRRRQRTTLGAFPRS